MVVGIEVESVTEPDVEQIATAPDEWQRERRTLTITGPPALFGAAVPCIGDRIGVDITDPGLTVVGTAEGGPVVTGQARQVSRVVAGPYPGIMLFASVDPTASPPAELMIRLLPDPPDQAQQ